MGRQESPQLIERKGQVDTDAQEISKASKYNRMFFGFQWNKWFWSHSQKLQVMQQVSPAGAKNFRSLELDSEPEPEIGVLAPQRLYCDIIDHRT